MSGCTRSNYSSSLSTPPPTIVTVSTPKLPVVEIVGEEGGWEPVDIISAKAEWILGMPYVTGIVKSNVGRVLTVRVKIDVYDVKGRVRPSTATETINLLPNGESKFKIDLVGWGWGNDIDPDLRCHVYIDYIG